MTTMDILKRTKSAWPSICNAAAEDKNRILSAMADSLQAECDAILRCNAEDMDAARGHISDVMLDRLYLDRGRIDAMADGIRATVALPDHTGRILAQIDHPNGMKIYKKQVPLGLVAIIYESRPNVTSDAAALPVTAGQTLTVTVFYRGINAMRTIGLIGGCSHAELGNCTRRPMLHMAVPMQHTADSGAYEVIPALTEVDVLAAAGTHACVIFGDSTVANELPRLLAARLRADGIGNVSVTQAAIKGDRLVADGVGRAAKLLGGAGVKRFGRDVLGQAGADMVLVKLGANDLIHPHCRSKQGLLTPVTFAQMTAGYRALADMAHAQGVRIWFCELTPWKGYTRNLFGRGDDIQWSPEYDALRLELNAWFQSADCPADGYIPLDALADPDDPDALIPAYTTDGVHHTPAGQRALAALIPEGIFG